MSIPKRVAEIKSSAPELWRAPETIWEITDSFSYESDIPPLGMVLYTVMTNGKHPYGLTGRRDTAPEALKVKWTFPHIWWTMNHGTKIYIFRICLSQNTAWTISTIRFLRKRWFAKCYTKTLAKDLPFTKFKMLHSFGQINKNKTMSSLYFVDQKLMPSRKRFVPLWWTFVIFYMYDILWFHFFCAGDFTRNILI